MVLSEKELAKGFKALKEPYRQNVLKFYNKNYTNYLYQGSENIIFGGKLLTKIERNEIEILSKSLNGLSIEQLQLHFRNRIKAFDLQISIKKNDLVLNEKRALNAIERLEKAKSYTQKKLEIIAASNINVLGYDPKTVKVETSGISPSIERFVLRSLKFLPENPFRDINDEILAQKIDHYKTFLSAQLNNNFIIPVSRIMLIYEQLNYGIWKQIDRESFIACFDLTREPSNPLTIEHKKGEHMAYILGKIDDLNVNEKSKKLNEKIALTHFGINNYYNKRTNANNPKRKLSFTDNEKRKIQDIIGGKFSSKI